MTCVSCWISHIPAKMRGWWICLPSRTICIVHYAARLDPCAWMGMGNWTRPGASSIQLLSLGRRSSTESGLKSASDTWRYQLCFSANWEIWSPEATGTHGYVCLCVCGYVCLFQWERRTVRLTTELVFVCDAVKCGVCVRLYVKYEVMLAPAVGGLCEQQSFGVDHEPCQGLVAVDYRARCPSALNKRMSRIKRQCSPVCCKLRSTLHIRDRQEAQEPLRHDGQRYWFCSFSGAPWSPQRLRTDATPNLAAAEGDDDDTVAVTGHSLVCSQRTEPLCVTINSPNSAYVGE